MFVDPSFASHENTPDLSSPESENKLNLLPGHPSEEIGPTRE